jgi:Enoyl-CoA hydratase/isomerase
MTGPAQMTGLRATLAAAAIALCLLTPSGSDGQSLTNETKRTQREMAFETLTVRVDSGVLFADIAAPPMNLLGPALVRDLVSLIKQAEADDAVKVLVFKSADPDYFISHVDVTRIKEYREEAAKLTGEPSIALLFRHLSASRLVTIAQIEGRVRGAGSEFVLAGDMRFAARESAIFGQPEQAFGTIPGGGAAQHLARSSLAHRIARFPAAGHVAVKDRVNAIALAPAEDFRRDSDLFGEGVRKSEAEKRIQAAIKRGFQTRDAEMSLGRLLGDLADR